MLGKKSSGLLAIMGLLVVGTASAQITGTSHDFGSEAWNPSGKICIVCHTPHNADTSVSDAPLWNHAVTAATFSLYSSPTFDSGPAVQPAGASKLCLSCHDGTIAVDSFGGATGTDFIGGGALIGTDLSDDHPVSFTYVTEVGLYDPTTAPSGLPGGTTVAADMLFAGQVECASCHDVHDDSNGEFLRKPNDGSALCLTCHDK